jgi:hypothetical protein
MRLSYGVLGIANTFSRFPPSPIFGKTSQVFAAAAYKQIALFRHLQPVDVEAAIGADDWFDGGRGRMRPYGGTVRG